MAMKCPAGHDSTDSDFCSDCGLKMPAPADGSPEQAAVIAAAAVKESCPKCKTERDDPSTPFCGVCGYNFVTGQGGEAVVDTTPATPANGALPDNTVVTSPQPAGKRMDIEVTFDESKPDAPKGEPARKFSLYDEESLVGRKSSTVPQSVGLDGDPYLSRKQLIISRQADGSYVVRILSDTNVSYLNGTEIKAGVEKPLNVGDKLMVGAFTVITVTSIR